MTGRSSSDHESSGLAPPPSLCRLLPAAFQQFFVLYSFQSKSSQGHVSTTPRHQLWALKARQLRQYGDKYRLINPKAFISQDTDTASGASLVFSVLTSKWPVHTQVLENNASGFAWS